MTVHNPELLGLALFIGAAVLIVLGGMVAASALGIGRDVTDRAVPEPATAPVTTLRVASERVQEVEAA